MATSSQHPTAVLCRSRTSHLGVSNNSKKKHSQRISASASRVDCSGFCFSEARASLRSGTSGNLFSAEVEEHNCTAGPTERLKDPSSELVEVANTFIAWYKLFRSIGPGKDVEDIAELTGLGKR